ncbi:hypothetical protein [Zymobacter sp. IVIA_5232.4 C2]|uniref:hypothetical protein n=1 Tax=Zymobacter sp. IVIA_5232.4 C2 TaxID=3394855 RepID=UPI0039C4E094
MSLTWSTLVNLIINAVFIFLLSFLPDWVAEIKFQFLIYGIYVIGSMLLFNKISSFDKGASSYKKDREISLLRANLRSEKDKCNKAFHSITTEINSILGKESTDVSASNMRISLSNISGIILTSVFVKDELDGINSYSSDGCDSSDENIDN